MRALFLNPPSYEGFDGGAGARYQARREIRSFWYPTWLAQVAAMVPDSVLVDAPPLDLDIDAVVERATKFELVVMHTSTPSVLRDVDTAARIKQRNPQALVGLVGAHTMVSADQTLAAGAAVDFVTTGEFDDAIAEIAAGRSLDDVPGIAWRTADGTIRKTPPRPVIENLDRLPFVVDVYARDLDVTKYAIGYLQHPYLSLYTGRGCRSRCSFCLWPQTISGHVYRTRSVDSVLAEMQRAKQLFPQVREFFFDDDTFTDDRPRAEAIARGLGRLGITWSCNAKANVPPETLRVLKDGGLRLLLVGYESGSQRILNNIRKGTRVDRALRFAEDCRRLGILVHGTFIVGLPGETRQTIEETIEFAKKADPYSIQVSLAAPYPGTALYQEARDAGWLLADDPSRVVQQGGVQVAALSYPELPAEEIHEALERIYRAFYMRPKPILRIVRDMAKDPEVLRRRLREGREFLRFMAQRRQPASA